MNQNTRPHTDIRSIYHLPGKTIQFQLDPVSFRAFLGTDANVPTKLNFGSVISYKLSLHQINFWYGYHSAVALTAYIILLYILVSIIFKLHHSFIPILYSIIFCWCFNFPVCSFQQRLALYAIAATELIHFWLFTADETGINLQFLLVRLVQRSELVLCRFRF